MTEVAAVILKDESDRILICRRGAGGNCAYLWEFPGGKREPQETIEQCAIRECYEELGVQVVLDGLYGTAKYQYPDREIAFTFFTGHIATGIPTLHVHCGMCWVTRDELKNFQFCPADIDILARLVNES